MIIYELCKQLKDAGFPQKPECHAGYTEEGGRILLQKRKDFIYPPTLEELIEACGEGFDCLGRHLDTPRGNGQTWLAWSNRMENGMFGATPEEAVANLWLELNKTKE